MAYLLRLIADYGGRLVLAIFLAAVSLFAMADGGPFPVTPGEWDTASCSQSIYPPYYQDDPTWTSTWACQAASGTSRACGYNNYNPAYAWANPYWRPTCTQAKGPDTCPAGATKSGDTCTCAAGLRPSNGQCVALPSCPEGQHEEGGACVPDACKPNETRVNGVCVPEPPCPEGQERINGVCKPNKCKAGASAGFFSSMSQGEVMYLCDGGCQVRARASICVKWDGKEECSGEGKYTGQSCTPGSEGTGGGGTGGDGDGDGGTGGSGDGDGGTGGSGDGDGGTGGTGGTGGGHGKPLPPPKPKDPDEEGKCPPGYSKSGSLCIGNPRPPDNDGKCPEGSVKIGSQCVYTQPVGPGSGDGDGDGDKSIFGGACAAGFTCEGDAIQCAVAREQHRRNCTVFEDKTPESELYHASKSKTGSQTGDLPGNTTIAFGADKYDSTNLLGSGSCIGDVTVDIFGKAVTLEMSRVCPFLEWFRLALLAVGAVLWVVIVFRS